MNWLKAINLFSLVSLFGCASGPVQQEGMITSCPAGADLYLSEASGNKQSYLGKTPTKISLVSETRYQWKITAQLAGYEPQVRYVHFGRDISYNLSFIRNIDATPVSQNVSTDIHTEKNYVVGEKMTTPVGGEMIVVRKYLLKAAEFATPTKSSQLEGQFSGSAHAVAGERYKILGTTQMDGERLYIIPISWSGTMAGKTAAVLARKDGTFLNQLIFEPYNKLDGNYCFPLPPDLRFELKPFKDYTPFGGEGNFQILYSGSSGEQIRLSYREFSPGDIARVAFYQELTYDRKSKRIRFRNIQIEVLDATNEGISFIVIAD